LNVIYIYDSHRELDHVVLNMFTSNELNLGPTCIKLSWRSLLWTSSFQLNWCNVNVP